MPLKPSQAITMVIAILVASHLCWWIFLSGDLLYTHERNAPNRAMLAQLHANIALGASYSDVLRAYWQLRTIDLQLRVYDPAKWIITTPLEPLEDNWEMAIEFHDGRVTAVRVRTPDELVPKGAPEDKSWDEL